MDEKEWRSIIPEEKHGDFDAFLAEVKKTSNPLSDLDENKFVELLKTNKELASIHDKRVSSSIDSWRKKNEDKIYQERYASEHPEETDEQKRIRALEAKIADSDARLLRSDLENKTIKVLNDKGLPTDMLDLLIGADEEKTRENARRFEAMISQVKATATTGMLKNNGRQPGQAGNNGDKYFTLQQLQGMTAEEQADNWEKVQESMRYLESIHRS